MRSCPYLVFALGLIVAVNTESSTVVRPASGCYGAMPAGTRQARAQVADDSIQLTTFYSIPIPHTETREREVKIERDGKEVLTKQQYAVTKFKMVHKYATQHLPLNEVRAFGMDRKRIAADRLADRLKAPRPVLYCASDEKVDTVYLRLVKPETIVLVMPRPPQHGYGTAPMAMPPGEVPAPTPLVEQPAPPADQRVPAPAAPAPATAAPTPPSTESPPPVNPEDVADDFPTGSQPLAHLASLTSEGKLRLRRTLSWSTEMTGYQTIVEGEDAKVAPVKVARSNRTETTDELDVNSVRAFVSVGDVLKEIKAEELARRLAKETAVLTSADGLRVEPYFLKIIKDGTLVLVVPVAQAMPEIGIPAAPPAPIPAPQGASRPEDSV